VMVMRPHTASAIKATTKIKGDAKIKRQVFSAPMSM